ncbi:bifunctional hydroxymethylpyrimidine kinase/phosphomethylpyrimidine kinase [Mailhella sp.]
MIQLPNILTIAGSDSGGGAGIQADLKTMTVMGAFGMSVITALTAQNGLGVTGIHAPEPEFAALQLRTVLEGFPVHGAKTGMLFNAGIIHALADILDAETFPLVVDPVCVSTSGHKLMEEDGIAALRERLFSRADLLTPNRPEAETFTGVSIKTDDDAIEAGTRLLDMGVKAVLMKGGHVEGKPIFVTDWLLEKGREPVALRQPHVDTQNSHGTGCTLSAAIATQLGFGLPLRIAVTKAQEFLNLALRHSYAPGKGFGPVNHMAGLKR